MERREAGDAWEAAAYGLAKPKGPLVPYKRPSETVLGLLTFDMIPQWFVTQNTGSQDEILEKYRNRFREGARA